jgi:hypothetical protein
MAMAPAFGKWLINSDHLPERRPCPSLENPKWPHLKTISVIVNISFYLKKYLFQTVTVIEPPLDIN